MTLACLGAAACLPDLTPPSGILITCSSDAHCSPGHRCGSKGWCITSGAVEDLTPPELVTVAATNSRTVRVTFNEPVDPSSLAPVDGYDMTPALDIVGVLPEEQSARILTAPQVSGRRYTLTIRGVADAAGNVVEEPGLIGTFDGEGDSIDVTPPDLVSPADGSRALGLVASLVWTARLGAESYVVEVDDVQTGEPLAGSPFDVQAPRTDLAVVLPDARSYVWRVRSDIMDGSPKEAVFHALNDTAYVYCAMDTACAPDDGAGNQTSPFKTISGALIAAAALDLSTVRVAARGGSQAYAEVVDLLPGISMYGGYTSAFDEASRWDFDVALVPPPSHETVVHRDETFTVMAYLLQAPSPPVVFDGFTVLGGSTAISYAMHVSHVDASLTVSHCSIRGGGTDPSSDSYALYTEFTDGYPGGGPVFERNEILGGDAHGGHYAVFNVASGLTIASSTLSGGRTALFEQGGASVIRDNLIIGGSRTGTLSDSWLPCVLESSTSSLLENNVIVGGSLEAGGQAIAVDVLGFTGAVRNNLIIGGEATGAADSYGLRSRGEGTFQGNTILGGAVSTGKSVALLRMFGASTVVDNVLATLEPSGERYGLYSDDAAAFTHVYNCVWASLATSFFGVSADATEIEGDPLFASGPGGDYYLSSLASGQANDSPCRDAGSDTAASLGLDLLSTSTDGTFDSGVADIGYHYPP